MNAAFPSPAKLLAAIADGQLTPEQCFEAYAARIARAEPEIGAFAWLDVEGARAALPHAVERGPLRGLPVGVKDIFDTADMPTAFGSSIHAGRRPNRDAAVVSMARRAGGSIVGKTTTTAFAYLDPTPTRNPRLAGRTPGGSSAGSAAAVAAGMVPFAIGSQTGGSTVRPASYCGVAGFKPSFKLIPTVGAMTYSWNFDTVGLFAPGVADVALFAEALTGRALATGRTLPPAAPRLGVFAVPDWSLASEDMRAAMERAMARLVAAGAVLVDIPRDEVLRDAWERHAVLQDWEAARALAWEVDTHGERLPPVLAMTLNAAREITVEAYDAARGLANQARRRMAGVFGSCDALILPAAPGAAPDMGSTGQALFNRLFTLTGDPAIAVPGLRAPDGAPLGLQVVGPFGEDAGLLAIAAWVEAVIADPAGA